MTLTTNYNNSYHLFNFLFSENLHLCFLYKLHTGYYANKWSWEINSILFIYFTVNYSIQYFKNKLILIIVIISMDLKSLFFLLPWYLAFVPSKNLQHWRPSGLAPKMTNIQACQWLLRGHVTNNECGLNPIPLKTEARCWLKSVWKWAWQQNMLKPVPWCWFWV